MNAEYRAALQEAWEQSESRDRRVLRLRLQHPDATIVHLAEMAGLTRGTVSGILWRATKSLRESGLPAGGGNAMPARKIQRFKEALPWATKGQRSVLELRIAHPDLTNAEIGARHVPPMSDKAVATALWAALKRIPPDSGENPSATEQSATVRDAADKKTVPNKSTFRVTLGDRGAATVIATSIAIEAGTLILGDGNAVVVAFAQGNWRSVTSDAARVIWSPAPTT